MKNFEQTLIDVTNDYAADYGMEAVFDMIFPGMSAGELLVEMYNSGLIPDDKLEEFLND